MLTKAMANSASRKFLFAAEPISFAVPASKHVLNMTETATKPSTNFGKRRHRSDAVGFSSRCVPLYDQYMDIRKAARPNNTFCDDFIITLYFSAVSPMNLPEATTAHVVSIVPPSHAPATSCDSPIFIASQGMTYIIGMAITRTSDIT